MDKLSEAEYNTRLEALQKEHKQQLTSLAHEYAVRNREYKVGDILRGDYAIISVETIGWNDGSKCTLPHIVYVGMELTKKLVPKKNARKMKIPQFAVVEKISKKVCIGIEHAVLSEINNEIEGRNNGSN